MVIVLIVVSNEGDIMPPHVFTEGLRVNNDEFIYFGDFNKTVDGLGIRKLPLHLKGGQRPC